MREASTGMDHLITTLLPHRPPMLFIEHIVSVDMTSATVEKRFGEGGFGTRDGFVLDAAVIECVAQAVATVNGYIAYVLKKPVVEGMLVGISDFSFSRRARAGIRLRTAVRITGVYGGFCFAEGTVTQGDEEIASGTLKFYLPEDDHGTEEV